MAKGNFLADMAEPVVEDVVNAGEKVTAFPHKIEKFHSRHTLEGARVEHFRGKKGSRSDGSRDLLKKPSCQA